jgi:beta-lactamase class A
MMRLLCVLSTALLLSAALAFPACALAERDGLPALLDAHDATLQRGLEAVVAELGLAREVQAGRLSLAVIDVTERNAPRLAMLNGDEMMYAASLPKIAILLGAFAEAEAGRMPLDETRLQAMTGMIRYSSNKDATRVLEWVGEERLLEILQSPPYRFYDAGGAGGLWVGKSYGKEGAYRRDPIHNLSHGATAFQVARLYYLLANDALLTPRFNTQMKEILSNPGIHHKFVKALEGIPGIRIFRKSGTWKDHHADSALVEYGAYRYVLVGLAEHPDGGEWLVRLALPLHRLLVGSVAHDARPPLTARLGSAVRSLTGRRAASPSGSGFASPAPGAPPRSSSAARS